MTAHEEIARTIRGGCLCKNIRYEIEGPLARTASCHCTECRGSSGAPFLTFGVTKRQRFRYTKGTPKEYHSSPVDVRAFCADCGTQLTFWTERAPAYLDVTIGSLDDPSACAPEADIWLRSKLAWVVRDERLASFQKGRA